MTTVAELGEMTDGELEEALQDRGIAPGAVVFMVANRAESAWQPAVLAALLGPADVPDEAEPG